MWLIQTEEKLADIYFSFLKDYEKAQASYEKLIGFVPKLTRHEFYELRYGESIMLANNLNLAETVFRSYLVRGQSHEFFKNILFNLGLIDFERKNFERSIRYFREYINFEDDPRKVVRAKFLIANAFETSEQLKEAYSMYYSIQADYPNPEVIKNRLESLYNRKIARKR